MKKIIYFVLFLLVLINIIYLLRGFFVFPYPTGDGLARWLFVGKTIHLGSIQPVDDYPLIVPLLYSVFLNLKSFSGSLLAFFVPYLFLFGILFYQTKKYALSHFKTSLLSIPILTLPLLEQMSGRGMVGFADHFLAVFIASSLIFFEDKKYLLAVIFCILAANTKNEGQVFSLLVFIFYLRKTPLIWLIPLNLLLWRGYLLTQQLTWFYLTTPSTTINFSLFISRLPSLLISTFSSLFNPSVFSLAGLTLICVFLSQSKITRSQLLLFILSIIYLATFALTPTSINLPTHFAVAVDRLNLQLLVPFYLLTLPPLLATMRSCHISTPSFWQ